MKAESIQGSESVPAPIGLADQLRYSLGISRASQSLTVCNARIKLLKRHLEEWGALFDNQRTVRQLVEEDYTQKLLANWDDKKPCVYLIDHQISRLTKLRAQQQQERILLKARQQEELDQLKQLAENPDSNPSEATS